MSTGHTDLVPFGKYKGRPIYELIADRPYTDWLAAQPWFRERYGTVYNLVVHTGATPQDTPEHNAMQARYLDHDQALRLARPWLHDTAGLTALHYSSGGIGAGLTNAQRDNLRVADTHTCTITGLSFETHGWDVTFTATTRAAVTEHATNMPCICQCKDHCMAGIEGSPTWPRRSTCYTGETRRRHCAGRSCPQYWANDPDYQHTIEFGLAARATLWVELKPTIGDDYPTVLRTAMRRMQTMRMQPYARRGDVTAVVVLADEFNSTAVDLDHARKIFRSQSVSLLTTTDLPAAGGPWTCSCDDCTH